MHLTDTIMFSSSIVTVTVIGVPTGPGHRTLTPVLEPSTASAAASVLRRTTIRYVIGVGAPIPGSSQPRDVIQVDLAIIR